MTEYILRFSTSISSNNNMLQHIGHPMVTRWDRLPRFFGACILSDLFGEFSVGDDMLISLSPRISSLKPSNEALYVCPATGNQVKFTQLINQIDLE